MRLVSRALALVLAVVISGGCATGAEATVAQKSCCATMGHDCAPSDQSADCCLSDTHTDIQLTTAKTWVASVAVVRFIESIPQPVGASYERLVQRVATRVSEIPAYFLGSAFLV